MLHRGSSALADWPISSYRSVSGAAFLYTALRVYLVREGRAADHEAKRLFVFSIFYLFALFAMLLCEHTVTRVLG